MRSHTGHCRLDVLEQRGFVVLNEHTGPTPTQDEWERLEFMDWKSGGDTNFAPLSSASGDMECHGFWEHGKPDKNGIWTKNREISPTMVHWVENVGANYGRVRVIKLNPSSEEEARRQLHQDDNNRLNPEEEGWIVRSWLELNTPLGSTFIIREDKDDPLTETRIALHPGQQLVVDSERLWHVVHNPGPGPRYALIASFESGDALGGWIKSQLPVGDAAGAR